MACKDVVGKIAAAKDDLEDCFEAEAATASTDIMLDDKADEDKDNHHNSKRLIDVTDWTDDGDNGPVVLEVDFCLQLNVVQIVVQLHILLSAKKV